MVLKGQGCPLGSRRGHAAPEVPNRGSPGASLASLGSGNRVGIWFHFSVVIARDLKTTKQPNSISISLRGSFGVFWSIGTARTEYYTERLKQQEDILASLWPELYGTKSGLCSFKTLLCLGSVKG